MVCFYLLFCVSWSRVPEGCWSRLQDPIRTKQYEVSDVRDEIKTISLTRLNQAGLFVAFFFAVWGQTGVTTVAWSSTVGEATYPTDAVATVAGARTLTGHSRETQAQISPTHLDMRKSHFPLDSWLGE